MPRLPTLFYIAVAVLTALIANSVSAVWASKVNKFVSPWLLVIVVVSPLVFISFGLVAEKLGLSAASATVDVLLTSTTILVGLFFFHEWGNFSMYQLFGMGLALAGIVFMQIRK
ncbi:MAG: hypothetical protein U0514_00245 [Candidatus Andersenbacteria bacterium]